VPIVLKFGSLKLLESSGPVKASNGIALLYISKLFGPKKTCKSLDCLALRLSTV
jgi:hypothetical protein